MNFRPDRIEKHAIVLYYNTRTTLLLVVASTLHLVECMLHLLLHYDLPEHPFSEVF